jgi:hypothetical protein
MADDSLLRRALVLGGTIALPAPFPRVGNLCLANTSKVKKIFGDCEGVALLKIVHTIEPSTQIVRTVVLRHVRAIFQPTDPRNPILDEGNWSFFPFSESFLEKMPTSGIVFVPEHIPVMTKVIFSGTAAESAEYCPPIHRGGCDPDCRHHYCDPDRRRPSCDPDREKRL